MIYDIHIHLFGRDTATYGNYMSAGMQNGWIAKGITQKYKLPSTGQTSVAFDDRIKQLTLKWINESNVDKGVLLALDGAYTDSGVLDLQKSEMITSNDYVSKVCKSNDKLLFGASIHPYRHDALDELDRVVKKGACLVKWLPSAQNIDPLDKRCIPFYELMAFHQIPLLSHTGNEHLLSGFDQSLNHPKRLKTALQKKVKVIAAHLGAKMFLHETCYLDDWMELAASYENLFGDISAFINPVRAHLLNKRVKNSRYPQQILYGSDFPGINFPISFLFQCGWANYVKAWQCSNPIEQSYMVMKNTGLTNNIFHRAGDVLKITS